MRGAEHDAGPVGDQCLRGGEPKTAAAAGHEVNPVAQSKIHPAILPGAHGVPRPPRNQARDTSVRSAFSNDARSWT